MSLKEPVLSTEAMIKCEIDGAMTHSIPSYLRKSHPTTTLDEYKRLYPNAPLVSEQAMALIRFRKAQEAKSEAIGGKQEMRALATVFGLGASAAAMNSKGDPIMIPYYVDVAEEDAHLIPEIDPNYVFDIESVKSVMIANFISAPLYVWGYHGTGKTTLLEQIAARTNAPFVRIQHTANTEEAHIVGQYEVKDGDTVFNYGPLPLAMLRGHKYCADEYDRAPPGVSSVYQPVLEGKPLFIKEAPPDMRLVKPHPNFRFQATGNTNGAGDETGLYQGAIMQDAANYSRFGVTLMIDYMEPKVETSVVAAQSGIQVKDARKLVDFANHVRDSFRASRLSATISPRELIYAAKIGHMRGGMWREGLKAAWSNRLTRTDRETTDSFAQRVFG